ncbi:MAG: hypothetical protein A2X48_05575 [Lentisphaerae bacterium GWF2_49_21]|nr:MAG: hypothetical protein A2X48_05575 [Lentisphaerae bacterium GWF2_49_21]
MDYSSFSKNEIKKLTGSISQIAGIRQSVLSDGKGRGMRIAEVYTGSGLAFTVVPDRGMDIQHASYKGIGLAFITPTGYSHPSFYDPSPLGWLRNWGGGLVTGCGMIGAGAPDPVEKLSLHGLLSNTPAENIVCQQEWVNGKFLISVSGDVRESRMFGENLLLRRTVSTALGSNTFEIADSVRNDGFKNSPLMLLYHINIGFPMLSENSVIKAKGHSVVPRDEVAAKGIKEWNKFDAPIKNFKEQCFYHDIPADRDGFARCTLSNPKLGLDFEVAYRKKELPFFTEWKMTGEGEYVVGLEPANCHVEGQTAEKKKFKSLKILKPGETCEFKIRITIMEKS